LATWTCQKCGKVMATEYEYIKHICAGTSMRTCPECLGSGIKVQAIGPNVKCPRCGGKGKV